jgi:hypothetical protein
VGHFGIFFITPPIFLSVPVDALDDSGSNEMKAALTLIVVLAASSVVPAHALPGGGWDANNLKLSVSNGSKLLTPNETPQVFPPGGGWDHNDVKLSATKSAKLLTPRPSK